jgi:protein-L-isoaspartate(D-aspartate) O-methyltransferase
MADGTERMRLKGSISATSLAVLVGGLITGLLLGAILPGNLPGLHRGDLPSKVDLSDISQFVGSSRVTGTGDLPGSGAASANGGAESGGSTLPAAAQYDPAQHLGELPMKSEEAYLDWMQKHTSESLEYLQARWKLSRRFINTGELQGYAIEAFLKTPRELFVREKNLSRAYDDIWLPIGYGATITDPDVVSMMTTTLDVKPGLRVLEIGTGSGYQSAMLSYMTKEVYSIEIIEPLYRETDALYDSLQAAYPNVSNIRRKLGDGFYGWEKYAPFDRIIVTCAIDHLPPPLVKQLSPNGIMVVPLGPPGRQYIIPTERFTSRGGTCIMGCR